MNDNFWFYFLAATIILITSIHAAIMYKRKRVIYNLITLIVNIVLLTGIILLYFYGWDFLNGVGGVGVQISIIIVIYILFLFLILNRQIIQFIRKLKNKYK